jgi:acyl carrier protein
VKVPEHVRRFLIDELDFIGDEDELTDDYPLLDAGVLDSLGIMTLVEYLEAEFEIVIDEDDVVAERFETIDTVVALVRAKQAA